MRETLYLQIILCLLEIIPNSSGYYMTPVCGENGVLCTDKVFYIVDGGSDKVCGTDKVCRVLFCLGDISSGWYFRTGKRLYHALVDEDPLKKIKAASKTSCPDKPTPPPKPMEVRLPTPCPPKDKKAKLPAKKGATKPAPNIVQRSISYWIQPNARRPCDNIKQTKQPACESKLTFKGQNFKKCEPVKSILEKAYSFFFMMHMMAIFLSTYKFLRCYYKINIFQVFMRYCARMCGNARRKCRRIKNFRICFGPPDEEQEEHSRPSSRASSGRSRSSSEHDRYVSYYRMAKRWLK